MSKTLLIVHHTPSPHTQEMFEAVLSGATDPEIQGVEVVRRPALVVTPTDMLEADGYLLGTPANLGYMSGALKHAFDVCYYPCLDATRGRPFGLYLHGNEGTEGAERGVTAITTGLGWVKAAEHVVVSGKPTQGRPGGVLGTRRDGRRAANGWGEPLGEVPRSCAARARCVCPAFVGATFIVPATRQQDLAATERDVAPRPGCARGGYTPANRVTTMAPSATQRCRRMNDGHHLRRGSRSSPTKAIRGR